MVLPARIRHEMAIADSIIQGMQGKSGLDSRAPCDDAQIGLTHFAPYIQLLHVPLAGADGQLGARIIQKLLQAGYKVAAGAPLPPLLSLMLANLCLASEDSRD